MFNENFVWVLYIYFMDFVWQNQREKCTVFTTYICYLPMCMCILHVAIYLCLLLHYWYTIIQGDDTRDESDGVHSDNPPCNDANQRNDVCICVTWLQSNIHLYIVHLLIKTEVFIQGVHGFIEDFRLLVTRITKYLHMHIAYQANLNSTFVFCCNTTCPVDPLLTMCRTGWSITSNLFSTVLLYVH